jgi:hypothetical protein
MKKISLILVLSALTFSAAAHAAGPQPLPVSEMDVRLAYSYLGDEKEVASLTCQRAALERGIGNSLNSVLASLDYMAAVEKIRKLTADGTEKCEHARWFAQVAEVRADHLKFVYETEMSNAERGHSTGSFDQNQN